MDERNLPKSASGVIGSAAPEQGMQADSMLVFFGDPARVSEGFAIALRAMGVTATMADVVAQNPSEPENDHA